MTFDQKIQVWIAVGTWLASLGTIAAVGVALYLARRSEKISLEVTAGLRVVAVGDGTPLQDHLCIGVTNLGARPVTINTIGWATGRRKQRRYAIQPVLSPYSAKYPVVLAHGESALFMVSFELMPNWPNKLATGFVRDLSGLKSLRAQVHTSVGTTVEIRPRQDLLDILAKHLPPAK